MRFSYKQGIILCLVLVCLMVLPGLAPAAVESESEDKGYGVSEARKAASQPERWTTAGHEDFEKLQQDFNSGPQVTKACLSCHNKAGEQVGETIHWTWICPADPSGKMGKGGLTLNNF